jgi:ketosteroid isomerase-like protein
MKRLPALVAAALVAASLLVVNAPAADAAAEAGVDQLRAGLIDSFKKADIDRMLTFLSPDVVVTWQNGEVSHGPEEVRAYYNRMMKGDKPVVKEVHADPEILGRHFHGDWAVSWGNLHDHFILNDGRDLPLNTVFTVTTAKVGERWLVTGYHASVNAFDNPVLALAVKKVGMWAGLAGALAGIVAAWLAGRLFRKSAA